MHPAVFRVAGRRDSLPGLSGVASAFGCVLTGGFDAKGASRYGRALATEASQVSRHFPEDCP